MADKPPDEPETGEPTDQAWRAKRLKRGRWRAPNPAPAEPATVTKVVPVKLTEAELAAFDAQCSALGVKRNRLLRAMVRRASGYVEVDRPVVDELRAITRQISGVATNVNQIARVANQGQGVRYAEFMEERAKLGRHLARVEALMQQVLDHAARRSDGRRQLEALIRDE